MLNKTESGCWLSEAEQYYAVGRIYVCVNLCVCVYTYEYMHACTGVHTNAHILLMGPASDTD